MVKIYLKITKYTLFIALLLPALVYAGSSFSTTATTAGFWATSVALAIAAAILGIAADRLLRRLEPAIDEMAAREAVFLDELPDRWVPWAIAAGAAASLGLELAIIRWHGTVWEVFAFYKNFSLLACFAGLGLGYALAGRDRLPALMVLPLLAFQVLYLIGLRHGIPSRLLGSLKSTPIAEQLNMGIGNANARVLVVVYYFLSVVLVLTALAFLPVGQVCGRLLGRRAQLPAYGLNLLGSIAGVVLMMVLSYLWTPPVVWFLPCFAVLLLLQAFSLRSVLVGALAIVGAVAVLDWPVSTMLERIYSPYQLLERTHGDHGLTMIQAAGHYYQRIHDLSPAAQHASEESRLRAAYYELPYRLRPHARRVAIVGAGSGNDVAAALRMGAGRVDAIEIDPAIVQIGRFYHPEKPYSDRRVRAIINDARSFFRSTADRYDLIAYGLLDSHTLLSHASSVRLDSFVYTVEGIRDARGRLTDDGAVSLSFCVLSPALGRKIYLMMQEAFDGKPPVCIRATYDGSVNFSQSNRGDLRPDPALLASRDFEDYSGEYTAAGLRADVSTDDWPFFYMPRRIYPVSYVWMLLLILGLSVFLFGSFLPQRPRFSHLSYFFMGAGFMLVETKAITELGLAFGNTWHVIGIVIASILSLAYVANLAVARLRVRDPSVALLLLLGALGAGLAVARGGGLPATPLGQVATVLVLTCPMFFSGIAFSSLLAETGDVSAALAMNLVGAMVGGLLEYNSMYFGFHFLYWIAMALYLGALVSHRLMARV